MVDFNNTLVAYAAKDKGELKLARLLFSVLQKPGISRLGRGMLKFALATRLPIQRAVKATLYRQFIGGESIADTLPLMEKLSNYSVRSILDYSIEGMEREEEFDRATQEFLHNVEVGSKHKDVPFSVFKPSGIATHRILEKISSGAPLTESDRAEFERVHGRFLKIFTKASQLGVRVMVDAEESWIQQAIDDLTDEMMDRFNKERVIAMNTFQLYRKDRLDYMIKSYERCRATGIYMGAKLVRGAYLEKERERALEKGYESPVHHTKADTDRMFNDATRYCLDHLDQGEVFVGTHNEETISLALAHMQAKGIKPNDDRVWFSQLYGMSDYLTFNLGHAGYHVAKYIPYGPVSTVIPYLVRRADENSSVAGQAKKELALLNAELQRRG
ncbi:MAG: proline dehydrogenase family protein [Bacteroidetes bacterium]|nr:proline dehydrogenase family protein [Bacteroidota bacterium]